MIQLLIKEFRMIKQPLTNIKMTNVAIIRYKINNRMFEIACYRNKALNWRNGVEDDVSEVLQTQEIYENASHGTLAKKSDLHKFFPNRTKLEIIEIILSKGELQITDKQRENQQSGILAEIVKIIVEKCVHPVTKRRFTPETIRQAIKQIHFAVKTDQTAKKQALDCIKQLQAKYKIIRGDMRVKIAVKKELEEIICKELKNLQIEKLVSEELKGEMILRIYDIQPNKYRQLSQICKQNEVTVEVVINVVVNQSIKEFQNEQFSALEAIGGWKNEEKEVEQKIKEIDIKKKKKSQDKTLKCSTCGDLATFMTAADQRSHFKSDWHVENVKRKGKELPVISEQQFEFNKDYHS